MKIFKTSPKLHFDVTKNDPSLAFHFDDLNLLKSWSNLGLTKIQITIENSKNGKRVHILFLYIIDVDGRLFALF
jgi:hypothetical protein